MGISGSRERKSVLGRRSRHDEVDDINKSRCTNAYPVTNPSRLRVPINGLHYIYVITSDAYCVHILTISGPNETDIHCRILGEHEEDVEIALYIGRMFLALMKESETDLNRDRVWPLVSNVTIHNAI